MEHKVWQKSWWYVYGVMLAQSNTPMTKIIFLVEEGTVDSPRNKQCKPDFTVLPVNKLDIK